MIDGLTQGGQWLFTGPRVLTYSFNRTDLGGSWSSGSTKAFSGALESWSAVADLSFNRINSGTFIEQSQADLAVGRTGSTLFGFGAAGLGVFPDTDVGDEFLEFWSFLTGTPPNRASYPKPEGDMFFDDLLLNNLPLKPGSFMYSVFVHEIGHALGLKHPFDDGANGRPTYDELGVGAFDNGLWTVMSYDELSESPAVGWQATPMPGDILAIQNIYGANLTYRTGDDHYALKDDGIVKTIWDAGGIDTISAAGLPFPVTLDLTPGSWIAHGAKGSITAIAFNVSIENAIGTAFDDTLIGTDADNLLDGGRGADSMTGGDGNDTYVVDNPGDQVVENPGSGIDTLITPFSTTLPVALENLTLTAKAAADGIGNAADNILIGNSGSNLLAGLDGNDTLIGGRGSDHLIGGNGNDTYDVDNRFDLVEETGTGLDRVFSSVNFSLATLLLVEDLTLTGKAKSGTGNALDNVILGNAKKNILDGGAGADSLTGGRGNDTYMVDNIGDVVMEFFDEGRDLIYSSVTFILTAHIENLILLGTGNIDATGNDLANALTGNSADNRLDGGLGIDQMKGGLGDDTYVVDHVRDKVSESRNAGTDTVESSISYTLKNNLESLVLTGSDDIDGIGNRADNTLVGNAGDNLLDGRQGADTMIGGDGDDHYVVDNLGDQVIENPGEGLDTLSTRQSAVLPDNVENLTLTGKGALSGTGNALDNVLIGNNGANMLFGLGGADTLIGGGGNDQLFGGDGNDILIGGSGQDLLTGGAGSDRFVLQSLREAVDSVLDFAAGVGGDILDIGDLLDGFVDGVSDPNDFVEIQEDESDSLLRVDPNGAAGGLSYKTAFLLSDVTGLDVDSLVDDGNLVLV